MLFHFLLAYTVSDEKLAVILIFVSLYYIKRFFFCLCLFLRFLFTTGFNQFNYDVPWCSFLCFLGLEFVEILGSVRLIDFIKFGKISAIISSNIFSASAASSDSLIIHVLAYVKLSYNSQMLNSLLLF